VPSRSLEDEFDFSELIPVSKFPLVSFGLQQVEKSGLVRVKN
jgi:hypothetical protein